jgi:hypothetical protein
MMRVLTIMTVLLLCIACKPKRSETDASEQLDKENSVEITKEIEIPEVIDFEEVTSYSDEAADTISALRESITVR